MHSHGSQSRIGKSLLALSQRCSPATEFSRLAWGEQVVSFIMLNSDDLFIVFCPLGAGTLPASLTASSPRPGTAPGTYRRTVMQSLSLSIYL